MLKILVAFAAAQLGVAQTTGPLRLEKTIPLEDVQGRIDHLSIDVKGRRLFVAALGNNTLEVIDLNQNKRIRTIPGLAEPQGVLYVPSAERVFVANGHDGSVRIFEGPSLKLLKSVSYGDDADNLRYEPDNGHVWVGYGSGALGEMDEDGGKLSDIKLDAHPESFQLEKNGPRIFVNLPKSHKVAVVDRKSRSVVASWTTGGPQSNYPMALNESDKRLIVVCRSPARLIVLETEKGGQIASIPVVGDCDDVFYDEKRGRIYAIGGEGGVSVIQRKDPDHYEEIARAKTVSGARTGLFVPELDRLFVAARRNNGKPAEIRIYAIEN
jgi:YVTN family beta-propeller protein